MTFSKVGLIGTGILGCPMGLNLLKAGLSLDVYNRSPAKADPLVAAGARRQESAAAVARHAEIVISVVPDSPDVETVYLSAEGVCATLQPGTLCVDMSTIAPDVARHVAQEVTSRGGAFLDAPVSGGKTGAQTGSLSIMVGGEEKTVARAKPIFDILGKSTVHCGPVGNGQLTKLCNQILCGLNLLAVSEALVFAAQVGLDPAKMLQAVSTGAAGSWALDNLGSRMIDRDFDPMFMIDLQQKDLRLALDAARKKNVPLVGTSVVNQLLRANQAAGEGREGTQALIKTIERLAG